MEKLSNEQLIEDYKELQELIDYYFSKIQGMSDGDMDVLKNLLEDQKKYLKEMEKRDLNY